MGKYCLCCGKKGKPLSPYLLKTYGAKQRCIKNFLLKPSLTDKAKTRVAADEVLVVERGAVSDLAHARNDEDVI